MRYMYVRLTVEEKEEVYPEMIPMDNETIISRTQDVLADSTKHDEVISWRVLRVEQVTAEMIG